MTAAPLSQADRDRLADVGLADGDDRIGTGEHAVHVEACTPS
ncbi:hypothetical protein [Mycolicibacterium gilvum]